ncbi:MAG: hypothetical protein NZ840_12105 [Anaerolineales bacterium]|nr:hypothetical protein [Anaerolineales bacterium]MDW8162778.1 hypothetical protein [Anaerolineales bacterium]
MRTGYIFWVVTLFITSCQSATIPTNSPYPGVTQRQSLSEPTIQSDFSSIWNSTPQLGKSVIRGRIVLKDTSILIGELYLANAVPTSSAEILLLELDRERASKAIIDRETGRFIFLDIEPGVYGIIAWEPLNSFPLSDHREGKTLFIEVEPNEIIDLGDIPVP